MREVKKFLFEITLEDIKRFNNCWYSIKGYFADILQLAFDDPIEKHVDTIKRKKRRLTMTHLSELLKPFPEKHSVIIACNADALTQIMLKHPLVLVLKSKVKQFSFGLTKIPWTPEYINYLDNLKNTQNLSPVVTKKFYHMFDQYTSKKIAIIKLKIKFCEVEDLTRNRLGPLSLDDYLQLSENRESIKTISSDVTRFYPKQCECRKKRAIRHKSKTNTKYENDDKSELTKDVTSLQSRIYSSDEDENNTNNKVTEDDDFDSKYKWESVPAESSGLSHNNIPTSIFGNKVYCVNYQFEICDENEPSEINEAMIQHSNDCPTPPESDERRITFNICEDTCDKEKSGPSEEKRKFISKYELDLPEKIAHLVDVTKCQDTVLCDNRSDRNLKTDGSLPILLDVRYKGYCIEEKIETGEAKATVSMNDKAPCMCSCECTVGYYKKTTYCKICGGFEEKGEVLEGKRNDDLHPCPIFHKTVKEDELIPPFVPGSEFKRKDYKFGASQKDSDKRKDRKKAKAASSNSEVSEAERLAAEKKKARSKRFRYYDYNAPRIGHYKCSVCTQLCPKNMGWFWSAIDHGTKLVKDDKKGNNKKDSSDKKSSDKDKDEDKNKNKPQLKLIDLNKTMMKDKVGKMVLVKKRIKYRPGEASIAVIKMIQKHKDKQRRKAMKREKWLREMQILQTKLKRGSNKLVPLPLITVKKKGGEYTIQMKTMKNYNNQRQYGQYPYEDKPPVTYTVGRTESINRLRQMKRERYERRVEAEKRSYIEKSFQNMCQQICMKSYNQALGTLYTDEDPDCLCIPRENLELRSRTCLCEKLSESDSNVSVTDSDEWEIEFTPPIAKFIPDAVYVRPATDKETQYTYLDYRVKLLDKSGNPVPRFFTGPDGSDQCSDLGGFRGPDGTWLQINVDGFIAPDGRWAPNEFYGPEGEVVFADMGKFMTNDERWLVVGVDGYVGADLKWRPYVGENKKRAAHESSDGNRKDTKKLLKKGIVATSDNGEKTTLKLVKKLPKNLCCKCNCEELRLSCCHVPCFSSFVYDEAKRRQRFNKIANWVTSYPC